MARFNLPKVPDLRTVPDDQIRGVVQEWMSDAREILQEALSSLDREQQRRREPLQMPAATVAQLEGSPPILRAGSPGRLVYCTDFVDGATPAFSDGTNWLRLVTDRQIVNS